MWACIDSCGCPCRVFYCAWRADFVQDVEWEIGQDWKVEGWVWDVEGDRGFGSFGGRDGEGRDGGEHAGFDFVTTQEPDWEWGCG